MVTDPDGMIERELQRLLRRTQAIHVQTTSGDAVLERSAYGILCLVLDDGPQRLGTIAATFGLDPSTITRQVQAVVKLGLAEKSVDESDRRATILSLTEEGRRAIAAARSHRRRALGLALEEWSPDDRAALGHLLGRFNESVETWMSTSAERQAQRST